MSTQDHIHLKIGEVYYLRRVSVYHQCTLHSLHEFESTAKVDYYAEGEPVICRQSELITKEQYRAIIEQKRKEAYERDLSLRREQAKSKYAEVVAHWNLGLHKSHEMAPLIRQSVRATGQMIAAAKRWNLLTQDDPKPSDSNSSAGG